MFDHVDVDGVALICCLGRILIKRHLRALGAGVGSIIDVNVDYKDAIIGGKLSHARVLCPSFDP
jgi:hypothetical protein